MKYSSRFFLLAPVTLFLCFLAVAGVHWWLVADAFSAWLAKANGHEIAPGVTMRFASRQISGFPFSLDTVFRDVSFDVATPQGPIIWHTQHFAMHALTYGRDQTIFEAAGRQELDWTKTDGEKRALPFAVGSLHASSIVDKSGVERFDLDLVGFGSKDFTAQRLQFHIRRDKADTLDVVVMADGVREGRQEVYSEHYEGKADMAHVLDGLHLGNERWYEGLERWRLAGGRVDAKASSTDPCFGNLAGSGKLWLDGTHRLASSIVLHLAGPPDMHANCSVMKDMRDAMRNTKFDYLGLAVTRKLDFSGLGPLY